MRKISIRGVLVGGIVDVAATSVLVIPLVVYVMVKFDVPHTPHQPVVRHIIHDSPTLYGIQLLIGFGSSALGGYVAAWIAKHDELLNGTVSASLCVLLGVLLIARGTTSGSLPVEILLLMATPVCGFLGGYVRRLQKDVIAPAA